MPTVEEVVRLEIEQAKKAHASSEGSSWRGGYFNNFHLRFHPMERASLQAAGLWDRPMGVLRPDGYSELHQNQSPRQLYKTIDRAVRECGIALEDIQALVESFRGSGSREEFDARHQQFCDLVLPVYVKLREYGYVQRDLTGWTCCIDGH